MDMESSRSHVLAGGQRRSGLALVALACLAALPGLQSCASYIASREAAYAAEAKAEAEARQRSAEPNGPVGPSQIETSRVRQSIVASARKLLGQAANTQVEVRGRHFMLDCIGTVSAAWWGAGFDLQRDFARHAGNGVQRLYESCRDWGSLSSLKDSRPGDLIFWENTWDRNADGKAGNDGITHAGIVMQVDPDGTVEYLHSSETRGVVLARFNLRHPDSEFGPDGKLWNSPMYLGAAHGRAGNPPHWLSGDLWAAFGEAIATARRLGKS